MDIEAIIKNHAVNIVTFVKNFGNLDSEIQKKWCVDQLDAALELFDDKIPLVGFLLDVKIVDGLERKAIEQLVNWAFLKVESEMANKKN